MTSNVVQLQTPLSGQSIEQYVSAAKSKTPARFNFIVSQCQAENFKDEEKVHRINHKLVEAINLVDGQMIPLSHEAIKHFAEWRTRDAQATHIPFAGKRMLRIAITGSVLGEIILSATAFQGLHVSGEETYVLAFGAVTAALLAAKGIGQRMRWLPVRWEEKKPFAFWLDVGVIVFCVTALVAMMWAMNYARVGYASAIARTGGRGMAEGATYGLTLLQASIYSAQIAIFYMLGSANPVADRARRNYQAARNWLTSLHGKRVKIAAKLNMNVQCLRARHDARVEAAKQLMADWLCEMHQQGKGGWFGAASEVNTEIRQDWFLPVHERLCQPADAVPAVVQQILSGAIETETFTESKKGST